MLPIILSSIISWSNPIETFTIALSKSWMAMLYWIYVTGGARGVWVLNWLIYLRLNTLLLCSSSIGGTLKICFDGSQSCSFEIVMCWHVSILSSVGYQAINPHVDPTIDIGIRVLKSASIISGLWLSVGSSQIGMPKARHWLGFIKIFSILLPNHKPCPNISITTSQESILYEVALVHIGIFTCSE